MGQSERLYAGKQLFPGQWTVVAIILGGQGRGLAPLPAEARPGARCTRPEEPPGRQSREGFVENLGEMLHYKPGVRNLVHRCLDSATP